MGLFGDKAKKEAEKERENQQIAKWQRFFEQDTAQVKALNEKAEAVILFPGSVEEYERFKGYKVEIIDTGRADKSIQLKELFDCYTYRLEYSNWHPEPPDIRAFSNFTARVNGKYVLRDEYGLLAHEPPPSEYHREAKENSEKQEFAERMLLREGLEALVDVRHIPTGDINTSPYDGMTRGCVSSLKCGLPVRKARTVA